MEQFSKAPQFLLFLKPLEAMEQLSLLFLILEPRWLFNMELSIKPLLVQPFQ